MWAREGQWEVVSQILGQAFHLLRLQEGDLPVVEDSKSQQLLDVRNIELPKLCLEFCKFGSHILFKLGKSDVQVLDVQSTD